MVSSDTDLVTVRRVAYSMAQRYNAEDRYSPKTLTSLCQEILAWDQASALPGLDLGAGTCVPTSRLAEVRSNMIAFDLSMAMLVQPRVRTGFSRVIADVSDLPVRSSSCGLVTVFSALHLIPDKKRVVAEVARVLAPGGVFGVVHVERNDLRAQLIHKGFPRFHQLEVDKHVTATQLRLHCDGEGLNEVHTAEFFSHKSYKNTRDFISYVAGKPYFGLAMMDEAEFAVGLSQLGSYLAEKHAHGSIDDYLKLSLAMFRKR